MGKKTCAICFMAADEKDMAFDGARYFCPACKAKAGDSSYRVRAAVGEDPTNPFAWMPQPPRRASAMTAETFMSHGKNLRLTAGFIALTALSVTLAAAGHFVAQYHAWSRWKNDVASVTNVTRLVDGDFSVTFSYTAPERKGGTLLFGDADGISSSKRLSAAEYETIDALGASAFVAYDPYLPHTFVGAWEYDGKGLPGMIASALRSRIRLLLPVLIIAVGAAGTYWQSLRRVRGLIYVFENGKFVAASWAAGIRMAQAEHLLEFASTLAPLKRVVFSLVLRRLPYVWLVRTPVHPKSRLMILPAGQEPWYVNGMPVVCYLPQNPRRALMMPASVGWRVNI